MTALRVLIACETSGIARRVRIAPACAAGPSPE